MLKSIQHLIALLLVFLFVISPILAQRRNAAPKKPVVSPVASEVPEPAPTFDTLLAADSYKVYVEVRGVGGLIRSSAVNDLLDPVLKFGGPPREFKMVVKWLSAHSDALAGSRMLVAGWPSKPTLPAVLLAIEFSSPEEAKKFYPELRGFIPQLLATPTPTPTPGSAPAPKSSPAAAGPTQGPARTPSPLTAPQATTRVTTIQEKEASPELPYRMKQTGSLILISDKDFTFRDLRPRGSKPLEEDQNFALARNRFASESLFLYVETKSIEREQKEQRKKWEEEAQKQAEEAANAPKADEPDADATPEIAEPKFEPQPPQSDPAASPSQPLQVGPPSDPQATSSATLSAGPQRPTVEANAMMFSIYGALFGGENRWPEAVSAALVFEGDAYVLRTLIVNGAENKGNAIPFVPQFVSGPALVPESPNIFPADIDLFVSLSLDYPQIYDGMLKSLANAEEISRKYRSQSASVGPPPESPLAIYEKKLGLKIKDDLLPLLGNEIALALPKKAPSPSPTPTPSPANSGAEETTPGDVTQRTARAGEMYPVIAISVKDREAVGRLIPKIIESFGMKGANLLAQTEKRDGAEITSYGDFFAYAFVGDFLVVSPDPAATRHVVDAFLNHQTLSSDGHFRNFSRWQPRQVLGQVYVAPGLVEAYTSVFTTGTPVNDKMNEFLSRVNPVIDPLTYVLTADSLGPLHEMHVPKNLLQLIVAGISNDSGQAPMRTNEAMARSALRSLVGGEIEFKSDKGDGRYGTLEELLSESLINKELLENYGYRVELTVSGNRFEATAVPAEYGKTGRLSFFIDESGVLRAGDHAGDAATLADQVAE